MKWYILGGLIGGLCCLFPLVCLAETAEPSAAEPAKLERPLALRVRPPQQARDLFKKRNKQIHKLVKQYRKASAEQKAQIKEQLTELVSTAMDEGLAWSKERIADEKANLERWEQKMAEQEKQWPELKARRVDELLSGEGERRFKLAKKRWKKEMAEVRKRMR